MLVPAQALLVCTLGDYIETAESISAPVTSLLGPRLHNVSRTTML